MQGEAEHGILLTTGTFTAEARAAAAKPGAPLIELVDGDGIVELCRTLCLGLNKVETYELDHTFFEAFEQVRKEKVDRNLH